MSNPGPLLLQNILIANLPPGHVTANAPRRQIFKTLTGKWINGQKQKSAMNNHQTSASILRRIIFKVFVARLDMLKKIFALCLASFPALSLFAGQGAQRMLYTSPNMPFIMSRSGDHAVIVADVSGSIAMLQTEIANARSSNPTNVIIITLLSNATYVVSSASLTLDSRECLNAGSATIQAANSAVTVPLVQINSGATNVSIAGGTFDGGNANIQAIYAPAAGRVNVDKVIARNCGQDCILLKGQGNSTYDNEMTVTRSDCSGSPSHAGISIQNSTQTAVIDNNCHNNGQGVYINCAWADVANNTCESNSIGIQIAGGDDNVVANNTCNNNGTGIFDGALNDMILSCAVGNNSTAGISSSGNGSTFADNLFTSGNAVNFVSAGSGNNVIAYKTNLNASGQNYFYPPLIDNQHTNTIVNGMGRTDLTITSTTMDNVLTQYNNARSTNPNNVIVLHLNGTFNVVSSALALQSYTCVLLNGTIQINASSIANQAITSVSSSKFISVSGGAIDGSNLTGNDAIYFAGSSLLQVDGMTLRNFGPNNPRKGGSDILRITGGATPQIVTRCVITNGAARGIWLENGGVKRVVSDCEVTAVNEDGVDCDASTSGSVVKFNYCHDLVRYGVFFEQSASHNVALGNVCNDDGRDINIYNNSTTPRGSTEYNSVLCNSLKDANALRNGSTGTNVVTSSHNFIFNNTVINASISSETYGTENYYSQNYQGGGSLSTAGTESFFNSVDVSSNLFLQDGNSGLFAQIQGGVTANGAAIVINQGIGDGSDQWALIPTDSGYYRITNEKSQSVMAVSGASLNAGAAIVEWTFGSSKNDQWMPMSAGNGLYYFVNRLSGLCLDVPSGASGTQLDQQPYSGAANQQFNLLINLPGATVPLPFSLSVNPNTQTVLAGQTNSFTITIATNSNFSGSVNLSVSGLPADTTSNFNPASMNGSGNSTLTIVTATNTPVGVYALTITANGSSLTNTTGVNLIVNSSFVASPGALIWTGGSGINWSTALNWTNITTPGNGPPGATNDVMFTNIETVASSALTSPGSGVVIPANVNSFLNSSFTIHSLTNLNNGATANFHNIGIANNATLTVSGNFQIGGNTAVDFGGNNTVNATVSGAGATLSANNGAIVNETSASSGTHNATLDLSGLDNFMISAGALKVGVEGGGSAHHATGLLYLAKTNNFTITSGANTAFYIGHNKSSAPTIAPAVYLGISNAIFLANNTGIMVGRANTSGSLLAFNPAFIAQSPTAYFRGADSSSRVATWNVGDNSANANNSANPTSGTNDFSGGTIDALIGTMQLGVSCPSGASAGGNGTGTFTFNSGTVDVNILQLGVDTGNTGTSAGIGVMNVNGGLLNVNSNLQLGVFIAGSGGLPQGTLNVNGGTIQATNISDGGGIATINLNSGTIDLQGGQITNITTLNIGDGVSPAAQLINGAKISSPNSITVAANGTLAGNSTVATPNLIVNGTISPGGDAIGAIAATANVMFNAGGVFAVAVQNANGSSGTGFDFLQANGQLNIAASSTNPFVVQLQSFDPNGSGEVTNFNADTNYDWTITTANGGIANFDAAKFAIDTSFFQNDLMGGYFYIHTSGNSMILSFTNNHLPMATTYALYQSSNGFAIPISDLASNWNDPDGDPVALANVNDTSTNGAPVSFDSHFIYYTNVNNLADAIFYSVQDVRTNPPAIYRDGDTQRMESGEIIFIPAPPIPSVTASGNDFIFSGSNGIPGRPFYLLEATNVALPINQWPRVATNSFDTNGNFNFTNSINTNSPQQFYRLQL